MRFLWTADGFWCRGAQNLTLSLAVEMMAQAAVAEAPEEKRGARGSLAGIQAATLHGEVRPGDVLVARTELLGKLGGLVKVRSELLSSDGAEVAHADLLLAIES